MSLNHSAQSYIFTVLALLLAAIAHVCPALAAEIQVASTIDAVTVFPSGAEVRRTFTVDLEPGQHALVLHLPRNVEENSIQVEGASESDVAISSVDVRTELIEADDHEASRSEIKRQIEQHEDERKRLEQTIKDAAFSRRLMETLAQRKLEPEGLDEQPTVPSPQELSSLLDLVDGRISQLSKTVLDAGMRRRDIDQKIETLNERLEALAPTEEVVSQASIQVITPKATHATFYVSYRLTSASWRPMYEARLDTGEDDDGPRLRLVRHAMVVQATTERWDNVALSLSTARHTVGTSAPELAPQDIRRFARERQQEKSKRTAPVAVSRPDTGATSTPPLDGEGAVRQMKASATIAGFQALYSIPGRVTVDNTGTSKNVRIGEEVLNAELSLKAVPKLDVTAYLVAGFAWQNALPLLPGPVMLFRDDVFVGEGELPLLSPGEPFDLGFGADDLVRIERIETSRKTGETGLISTAFIDERSYLTTIVSQHSRAIPITILDQVPYADDERIRVEILSQTTKPSEKDVDGNRGVYAWSILLEEKKLREIRFGFRVTWPRDMIR